jgi:tRNA A-37 threonylcarbamoyl transferase component Bud32
MSEEALEALVGQTLKSAYQLESILGVGGMGAVFKGVQLTVDREVAVKVMRPMPGASADILQQMQARFRREATLTAKLQHPNTVQLIDYGATHEGMLFLVLEYLKGQELSRAMHALRGPMDPARVARIGQQVCLSLAEAHEKGLIHRDLKPDNIFLADYHGAPDHVKVMDFGIARILDNADQTSALTATGLVIGTPKYMAPEQVETKALSPQTDLYALGVILYELLTGKAPFHAESVMSLAFKHVHEEPPPLDIRFGDDWTKLIDWLLAKDPEHRPASAAELAGRLQQLAAVGGGGTPTPSYPLPTPAQTLGDGAQTYPGVGRTQKPIALMMGVSLVVLGLIVGVIAWVGGDEDGVEPIATSEVASPSVEEGQPEKADKAAGAEPVGVKTKAEAPEVKAKPEPPPKVLPTKLKLKTTPEGVMVRRHDKVVCEKTPCDVSLDGIGETVLTLSAPGYKERMVTVPMRPGSVLDSEYVLEKVAPSVTPPPSVTTVPPTPSQPTPVAKPKKKKKKKKKKATGGGFGGAR